MGDQEYSDAVAAGNHSPRFTTPDWWIYRGVGRPWHDVRPIDLLPPPPPWRTFAGGPLPASDTPPADDDGEEARRLGVELHLSERDVDPREVDAVNAALYLRRPLIVTGRPGTGKSTLAFRIARELGLGRVLQWSISSRTTLRSGLYEYDPIGRVQAAAAGQAAARGTDDAPEEPPIGDFVRLGPLGTAFLPSVAPRVLLIDEFDKSEVDLPNDLLGIFENGQFSIPELARVQHRTPEVSVFTDDPDRRAVIHGGRVQCREFPVVVITSNGERDFPEAFLRRCLQLRLAEPGIDQLTAMVAAHLRAGDDERRATLIQEFVDRSAAAGGLPANKLLDAVFLATSGAYDEQDESWPRLLDALWRRLISVS